MADRMLKLINWVTHGVTLIMLNVVYDNPRGVVLKGYV